MTKTILAKTAVATVIMLCFALTSCEPDRHWRYSKRDLYGKWYSTSTDGYYLTTITMYSDGLGYIEDWEGDYLVTRDRFEWEADRRYIYVYYYDYGIEERWRPAGRLRHAERGIRQRIQRLLHAHVAACQAL